MAVDKFLDALFNDGYTLGANGTTIDTAGIKTKGVLTADGAATVGSLDAGSGLIQTTGNATIGGTLGVTGAATVGSLDAGSGLIQTTGNATIGGTLGVTGAATVGSLDAGSGLIQTTGNIQGAAITGSGIVTGSSLVASTGNVTASSGNLIGSGVVTGTLTATGAASVASLDAGSGLIQTTGNVQGAAATFSSLDAGSGLIQTTGNATIGGTLGVGGNITASANLFATVDSGTDTRYLQIGGGRGAGEHGYAYIDLIGSGDNTTYSTRIIRDNSENGHLNIYNKGTGNIRFYAVDAGGIWFHTNNTVAFDVDSSQNVDFRQDVDVGGALDVTGAATISNNLDIAGELKVSSGYSFTAHGNANNFQIIDNGPATGMSIMASTTGISSIYFADSADNDVGQIEYWHNGNTMRFTVDGTTRATLSSSLMQLTGSLELGANGYLGLPVKSTAGNPSSPADGWMYVNTNDNAVRVYADGDWRDLATW